MSVSIPLSISVTSRLLLTGLYFFFFNDTATTEIYTLSLHDALPIYLVTLARRTGIKAVVERDLGEQRESVGLLLLHRRRSEEHTSELQSRLHLVCRLLLEKKKNSVGTHTLRRPHMECEARVAFRRDT